MSASPASLKRPSRRKPLAACIAGVCALSASALVYAAPVDWQVVNCKVDGSNGSLPWAAANANGANGDTINLTTITDFSNCNSGSAGPNGAITHTIPVTSTVTLATGGVVINGPGSTSLAVSAGAGAFRVFSSPGDLTINGLTVKYAAPTASSGTLYGGCVYARNNVTLNDVGFTHCYAYNSAGSAKGGAVASYDNDVSMTNVTINRTHAKSGGTGRAAGGAVYAFHNITMNNSTITTGGPYLCLFPPCTPPTTSVGAYVAAGSGSAQGGGVFSSLSGYSVTLSNGSTIKGTHATQSDNTATGGSANGGAIWASGGVSVANSYVSGAASTASTSASATSLGGGIYTPGNVLVDTSSVESSSTSSTVKSRGGGIYTKGHATLKYAYITGDHANGSGVGQGGGVFANNGVTSNYSYFWSDSAGNNGGAISVPSGGGGNSLLRGTSVTSSSSGTGCCGGILIYAGGTTTVTVEQSTISYNHANSSADGAGYIVSNNTKLYNNTIVYNTSNAGPTAGLFANGSGTSPAVTIASNLMASNSYGSTRNDFFVSGVTLNGDHNLIRDPGTGVPGGTVTGKCPLLYPGVWTFLDKQWQFVIRHEVPSPATNAGSNPVGFNADQRGGQASATSPPRVSGPPGTTPLPDIGSYEVNQSDEIFDERFEGCRI